MQEWEALALSHSASAAHSVCIFVCITGGLGAGAFIFHFSVLKWKGLHGGEHKITLCVRESCVYIRPELRLKNIKYIMPPPLYAACGAGAPRANYYLSFSPALCFGFALWNREESAIMNKSNASCHCRSLNLHGCQIISWWEKHIWIAQRFACHQSDESSAIIQIGVIWKLINWFAKSYF